MSELERLGDRAPVLVGVGTAHRDGPAADDPEPVDLMVEAATAALGDADPTAAGLGVLRSAIGVVAVPQGTWSHPDPGRLLADRLGLGRARTVLVEVGVPQCTPIRVAVERIRRGELDAALVVGGEAKATRQRLERSGRAAAEVEQPGAEPDERWRPEGELMAEPEIAAGLWDPVAQYACIENALRAAEGRTVDEHLDEVAALWARCNEVAQHNPRAAFREPRDAAWLRVAGEGNRPLAFPYAKWHSTQWAVDQAGALLLCSAGTARRQYAVSSPRPMRRSVAVGWPSWRRGPRTASGGRSPSSSRASPPSACGSSSTSRRSAGVPSAGGDRRDHTVISGWAKNSSRSRKIARRRNEPRRSR